MLAKMRKKSFANLKKPLDKSPTMKYLLLIVRYLFPKKRWTIIQRINIVDHRNEKVGIKLVSQDQFGNIKTTTIA